MAERNASVPSAGALFVCFARISLLSVGGGLSGWIRRSVVERDRWMDETEFLSGYALSQVAPGPSAINLAVFVGTTLRGTSGACASLAGLLAAPFVLILVLGSLLGGHSPPPLVGRALAGVGAGAIGLMIATGIRMGRTAISGAASSIVALLTTVALLVGVSLPIVLVSMVPVALLALQRRR